MPVETREPYAGPVRAIDLERDTNTGRIYHLHRATVAGRDTCNGSCQSVGGCECFPSTIPTDWRGFDACAVEGGKHADPVPSAVLSMRRHSVIRYRAALALLLAVAGFLAHIAWPHLA